MTWLQNVNKQTNKVIPLNDLNESNVKKLNEFWGDLQGNILKGHGRNKALMFFLKFNENEMPLVKEKIREFSKEITSFKIQLEESKHYRSHRIPGSTFVNFFLTAKGYQALGYSKGELEKCHFDECFLEGMKKEFMQETLYDPHPKENWDGQYWDKDRQDIKEIHALLLVADDDEGNLGISTGRFFKEVLEIQSDKKLVEIVAVERADQLRNKYGEAVEHFGYRDGISNPLFLESDKEKIEEYGGRNHWDPLAPLDLVLCPDPFGNFGDFSCGSYLVYRKYEQNVKKFETLIHNLAMDLGLDTRSEEDLEKAHALVMGRFRDGTPLAVKDESRRYYNENINNFTYDDDPSGSKCPFHAHIRKVNPRTGDGVPRIVRRGMTYGERTNYQTPSENLSTMPTQGVGLLFMSFQKCIEEQFVRLQKDFSNNPDGSQKETQKNSGTDSIIGQEKLIPCTVCNQKGTMKNGDICQICVGKGGTEPPEQPKKWPLEWGTSKHIYSIEMRNCITLKGGEFFFAPSISFLRNIGLNKKPSLKEKTNTNSKKLKIQVTNSKTQTQKTRASH
ncbi:MAG: Dyp-type peroxidase [Nitrospirales bacterium]